MRPPFKPNVQHVLAPGRKLLTLCGALVPADPPTARTPNPITREALTVRLRLATADDMCPGCLDAHRKLG